METRQNTNDFAKGMTNIPSDNICPDDSVAAEWNMIFRNGEHCPIQAPVAFDAFNGKSSFYISNIHKVKKGNNYIGIVDGSLRFSTDYDDTRKNIDSQNKDYSEGSQITYIGNTLIVNVDGKELRYFLWEPDKQSYTFIGNRLPKPDVKFRLLNQPISMSNTDKFFTCMASGNYSGSNLSVYKINDNYGFNVTEDIKKTDSDAFVVGLYESAKNKVYRKKGFCNPFFVRYALKLFDGSYFNISEPQLMLPTVKNNLIFLRGDFVSTASVDGYATAVVSYCELIYSSLVSYERWSDIVKSISVFITKPVDVVDTESGVGKYTVTSSEYLPDIFDTVSCKYPYSGGYGLSLYMTYKHEHISDYIVNAYVKKEDNDILNELKSSSVFYKLFDIDASRGFRDEDTKDLFKWQDLANLTTLEQLDHDDYYSKCPLSAENIYMYNKRLHLSNVSRGFYKGTDSFLRLETIEYTIIDRISINTPGGRKVILHKYKTKENPSIYFFYPDARAFHVDRCIEVNNEQLGIIKIGETECSFDLKPHPFLNGSYYLRSTLPTAEDNLNWNNAKDIQYTLKEKSFYTEIAEPENLSNEVWVSEVNNPFVFNAQGVNTVGNGEIIRIISNTQAISQGQFGQFPLFCLTTDGVWTLQVSSTGEYSSSHPISREVCNNKHSIVATDNLVFFSSEKGLMMINGSEVSCVSSQLNGKTFYPTPEEDEIMVKYNLGLIPSLNDFLRESMIAYDYRDNLLWITNPKHKLLYILSIDSGAFGITTLDDYPVNIINDYPDTIIETKNQIGETTTYKTLSLINRPNINDDERRIKSFIFSRPLKIGDQNSLKTPTMIRYIGNNNQKAVLKMRLFASDDLINWVRINSLRGRGFKYYKYNLIFDDLLPTDTFSGITEKWQFKYQSKFR